MTATGDITSARVGRHKPGKPRTRLGNRTISANNRRMESLDAPSLRTAITRAESRLGQRTTAAFVAMLAVGRAGWREQDFRSVVPRLGGEELHPDWFDQLFDAFTGEIAADGLGRWDVESGLERTACGGYVREVGIEVPRVHASLALHLLDLTPADPLRVQEAMYHLLGAQAWERAAAHLAGLKPESVDAKEALKVMADLVRSSPPESGTRGAETLSLLLQVEGLDADSRLRISEHLLSVHCATQGRCSLASEATLLGAVEADVARIVEEQPADRDALKIFATCVTWRGNLRRSEGKLQESIDDLRLAEQLRRRARVGADDRLDGADPGPNLAIGDALLAKGDLDGAMAIYGDVAHASSAAAQIRIGHVLRARGDLGGAIEKYHAGLDATRREMAERPDDDHLRLNLSMGLSMVATAHMLMGDPEQADPLYEQAEAILGSLAARHQADPYIRSEWATMLYRLGQPKQALGNDEGARRCFERASSLMEDVLLRHSDEPNNRFQRALFEYAAADMQAKAGDTAGAHERWKQSRREMAALLHITPDNQEWQNLLRALDARLQRMQERPPGSLFIAGALERLRGAWRRR